MYTKIFVNTLLITFCFPFLAFGQVGDALDSLGGDLSRNLPIAELTEVEAVTILNDFLNTEVAPPHHGLGSRFQYIYHQLASLEKKYPNKINALGSTLLRNSNLRKYHHIALKAYYFARQDDKDHVLNVMVDFISKNLGAKDYDTHEAVISAMQVINDISTNPEDFQQGKIKPDTIEKVKNLLIGNDFMNGKSWLNRFGMGKEKYADENEFARFKETNPPEREWVKARDIYLHATELTGMASDTMFTLYNIYYATGDKDIQKYVDQAAGNSSDQALVSSYQFAQTENYAKELFSKTFNLKIDEIGK
ncbi:MAG: hypothetical protein ACOX5R_16865 [bacterium]|jgi:hypothetical protein